jgi:hypothetical protein
MKKRLKAKYTKGLTVFFGLVYSLITNQKKWVLKMMFKTRDDVTRAKAEAESHEITMGQAQELVAMGQFATVEEAWEEAIAICEQGAYEAVTLLDDDDDDDDETL